MTGLIALTSHPAAARLGFALLHFVWQGAALAFIAAVLLAVLRKASAGARYLGLLIVFGAMAACPVVTFALARDVSPAVAASAPEIVPREQASPSPPPVADNRPPLVSASLELDNETPDMPPVPEPWVVRSRNWVGARLPWITLLWLTGVVLLSLRLLTRWWAVGRVRGALGSASAEWQHRLRRLSLGLSMRRPVRLLTSAAARVPMVIGWLRPAIVIPASALTGLTPDQLAAILAHELAHLRRCDHFVNLAQTLVEILLFYHPAVWWVSSAIRAERENCCDDAAVRVSGDVVGYMRALAWIEQNRGSLPAAAIASSGTSLLSRIRRLAGAVSPPAGGYSWLAGAMALGVATALPITAAVSGLAAGPGPAHHALGAREQWQPQTESDPRLQQPVHIEIIGRAALPAVAMLSEQTGVSLAVAPENLDTVGERKLTIIAQGCSLKTIMVQIPTALQECHWDIDPSGSQPAYLLHRNGSADTAIAQLASADEAAHREEAGPVRAARIDDARKALQMSPAELAELDKTDPFLAATMKDPLARGRVDAFLSLPAENVAQFIENGGTSLDYGSAPDRLRASVQADLQALLEECKGRLNQPDSVATAQAMLDRVAEAFLIYRQVASGDTPEQVDLRISFSQGTGTVNDDVLVIPPKLPQQWRSFQLRELLRRTGTPDGRSVDAFLDDLRKRSAAQMKERAERRRAQVWREPRSPELHRTIMLPFKGAVDPVEVQQFIAKQTGLSLVSDYFTTWPGPEPIPEEAKAALPAWRILHLLGENWLWTYDWHEAGDCLVFHNRDWYRLIAREVPESLVYAYTAKLKQQGGFTLAEVANLAAAMAARRQRIAPSGQNLCPYTPAELDRAGLGWGTLACDAVVLYANLSPKQRAKARTAAGLPYRDMTSAQQELVQRSATAVGDSHLPARAEEAPQAVYRVEGPTHAANWYGRGPRELWQLLIVFPTRTIGVQVRVPPPRQR